MTGGTHILLFTFLFIGLCTADTCQVTSIQVDTVRNGTGLSVDQVKQFILQSNITFGDPSSHFLSCVDGRSIQGIMATPGGDSGEFLLALTTFWQNGGNCSTEQQVITLFRELMALIDSDRFLYMHTDQESLDRLGTVIKNIYPSYTDISDIPPEYQDYIYPLLTNSSFVGCGHLRLLLQHPDQYLTPSNITTSYIKAFFDYMWNHANWTKLKFQYENYQVLQGNHTEQAVVNILPIWPASGACASMVPLVAPKNFFINHPNSVVPFRNLLASYFTKVLGNTITTTQFRAQMDALAATQIALTLGYLAANKPIFNVKLTVDAITINTSTTTGATSIDSGSMPAYGPALIVIFLIIALVTGTIIIYFVNMYGIRGSYEKIRSFVNSLAGNAPTQQRPDQLELNTRAQSPPSVHQPVALEEYSDNVANVNNDSKRTPVPLEEV